MNAFRRLLAIVWLPVALSALFADSCGAAEPPDSASVVSGPGCPPARGVGTIAPAITIRSMTVAVNGVERTVSGDDTLRVSAGDVIRLRAAAICVEPFSGDGGNFCVDISPTDRNGAAIFSEHKGTHMMPVEPGVVEISGLEFEWTVGDDWKNLTAVVNHWTPGKSRDLECADGLCERDDRVIIEFR
jgi:hypothetical protein